MRPIDADALIQTRFEGAFMDDEGEVLIPLNVVINAIRMAPTITVEGKVEEK